jgi:hypothetical protein
MRRLLPWLLLISTAQAEIEITQVNAMRRVMRTESVPKAEVVLESARGEWESLQIIVSGPASEVCGVKLTASELKGAEGAAIKAPIVLREHYVKVVKSTPMSPLPLGDYPDALVPQDFPWQDLPNEKRVNQPFWVDVFVPYGTKPGLYAGQVNVSSAEGKEVARTSLSVQVSNLDLPVVPRMRSSIMTIWRAIAKAHGFDHEKEPLEPELAALLETYYDLFAEHRLSIDATYPTYPSPNTGKLEAEKVEAGMRKHLLHRHASTLGLPLWPTWPFADPLGKNRAAAMRYCADWMRLMKKIGCEKRGYFISGDLDEPNSEKGYAQVRLWGDFFNEAEALHGVQIPMLCTEQPAPDSWFWGRLDDFVDIWVPHVGSVWEDLEGPKATRDIPRRLKAGDEVWCYTALVQTPAKWLEAHGNPKVLKEGHPPVWCLDFPPINHRILGWLMPLHGITGVTYWDTLYAHAGIDPWQQADSFHTGDSSEVFNGDGSFIYPATQKRHGRHQPVASIRLKWLREMADDYDYIMMARDLGLEKEARSAGNSFARGFGDWNDDVEKLYVARRTIAEMLAKKGGNP